MKVGFTTLAMFMDDNLEIIKVAKENNFEMIEILGEAPFFMFVGDTIYILFFLECWRELYYLVNYLINQQKFITNVITY